MQDPPKPLALATAKREVLTSVSIWATAVAATSASGRLAKLPARLVAPLMLGGIVRAPATDAAT